MEESTQASLYMISTNFSLHKLFKRKRPSGLPNQFKDNKVTGTSQTVKITIEMKLSNKYWQGLSLCCTQGCNFTCPNGIFFGDTEANNTLPKIIFLGKFLLPDHWYFP